MYSHKMHFIVVVQQCARIFFLADAQKGNEAELTCRRYNSAHKKSESHNVARRDAPSHIYIYECISG